MKTRGVVAGLLLATVGSACTGSKPQPIGTPSTAPTTASTSAASMTVTPAQYLQRGQSVEVNVAGFPPGAKVRLSECADRAYANPNGCGDQLARQPFLAVDDHGVGAGRFTVRAIAATGAGQKPTVPCRYTCVLVATPRGISRPVVAVAALRFVAPVSPTGVARLHVRPAIDLRDGQRVTLDVTRFLPGEKVWFSECAPTERPSPTVGCGEQVATEAFTVTGDAGARHGTTFRVTATIDGQHCQASCSIAAIGDHELAVARIRFR